MKSADLDDTARAVVEASRERAVGDVLRVLADRVPAMLALWDEHERCVYANAAYLTWFGVTPDWLRGRHISELLGPLYALNRAFIERALAGEEQRFEREIPDPAGGPPRQAQAYYLPNIVDGVPRGFFAMVIDLTQHREAEAAKLALARAASERLAALSRLAAGLAHEINNPLSITLATLDALERDLDEGAPSRDALRASLAAAREGAERAGAILQGMKLLARGEGDKREPVDIDRVIATCVEVSASSYRYRARLVTELASRAVVSADEAQLSQVFVHLLINAAQSMADGGVERNELRVRSRVVRETVEVDVCDTGTGIDASITERVFEPFFTTRAPGGGVGLGLTIAQAVITGFGGSLKFQSELGKGTTFTLRMPLLEVRSYGDGAAPETIAPPSSEPSCGDGRRAHVVLVDDERALVGVLARCLARRYEVSSFVDSVAALEALASLDVDIVVCDVMMPKLTGPQLYQRIVVERPALADRFLFMTGGAYTDETRAFLRGRLVLDKPFSAAVLREAIAKRLNAIASPSTKE